MPAQKGNILLPLLAAVAVIAVLAAGYLFYSSFVKTPADKPTQEQSSNTNSPTPIPTVTQDETASWKTYANSTYGYSIKTPASFSQSFCSDCNPPDISVNFQNPSKTINVGVSYSFQSSLCANNTLPCTPVKNLKNFSTIQTEDFQEYYSQDERKYIFSIHVKNTQLDIGGSYKSKDEIALIDQILSTFRFL